MSTSSDRRPNRLWWAAARNPRRSAGVVMRIGHGLDAEGFDDGSHALSVDQAPRVSIAVAGRPCRPAYGVSCPLFVSESSRRRSDVTPRACPDPQEERRLAHTGLLARLTGHFAHHPWRVVITWILILVAMFTLNGVLGGKLKDDFKVPGTDFQAATDLIQAKFGGQSGAALRVVVAAPEGERVDTPERRPPWRRWSGSAPTGSGASTRTPPTSRPSPIPWRRGRRRSPRTGGSRSSTSSSTVRRSTWSGRHRRPGGVDPGGRPLRRRAGGVHGRGRTGAAGAGRE